jgi:hypothetical protein
MVGAFCNRHTNIKSVLANYVSLVDASQEAGVSESYLSQLKGGKHMGHVMARRLEHGLGLDSGWLDLDHSQAPAKLLSELHLTEQALELSAQARLRMIKKLVASLP